MIAVQAFFQIGGLTAVGGQAHGWKKAIKPLKSPPPRACNTWSENT